MSGVNLYSFHPSCSRGKYHGDVRDKTFSAHVMPENSADVSESAVFTHVRSQGYVVNANMSEIDATSGRDTNPTAAPRTA